MSKVCVHMATGFEETEAIAVIDVLRRAEIETIIVSVTGELIVKGAHDIDIKCDSLITDVDYDTVDMIVLPGGMPGTLNLKENKILIEKIEKFFKENKYLAAICAAPSIYGEMGILEGKEAVCYPGFEKYLKGATIGKDRVVKSGKFITSKGPGTALNFGLEIVKELKGVEVSEKLQQGMLVN